MITNDKQIIHESNIVAIIGDFVDLKPKGRDHEACCPFHAEKSPSFKVSASRGTYKCFGCGESGDAAAFLMKHKGMSYPEAIRYIAKANNTDVQESEERISKEERDRIDLMYAANEAAIGALFTIPTGDVTYGDRTWSQDIALQFRICQHPGKLPELGADVTPLLKDTGWIREGKNGDYAFFHDRILFPVFTENGRIAGVTARRIGDGDAPKYINSPESDVFKKEKLLYGLHQHRAAIRTEDMVIITEGATDVIALSAAGIQLSIAALGTSLSISQSKMIRRHARRVILLYDADKAGINAARRSTPLLVSAGCMVDVCFMPEGEDPDSFIRKHGAGAMAAYLESDQVKDAIRWYVVGDQDLATGREREAATARAIDILSMVDDPITRKSYIRTLCTRDVLGIGISRELGTAIEQRISERKKRTTAKDDVETEEKEGTIIERDNVYRIDTGQMEYCISNFVIRPIMLVIGAKASERVFEITNFKGRRTIIAISTDDFVEIATFKKCIERFGNYMFYGSPKDFTKLREYIYEKTPECHPITMLGQHKEGFWSWANGLSIGNTFSPVDDYGVVKYGDHHYYLPACSKLGEDILADDSNEDYEALRQFSYIANPQTSIATWATKMKEVHGPASLIAVPWMLASIFYDVVFRKFRFFPHLNLFGPPGSGKTYMATSLMGMFGKPRKPFGLAQGSDAAFFRSLSQFKNAVIWFDEYSNNIDRKRADAIKNAYDGTDRIVGQKSNDNKTHAQRVTSAIILSGQDQPTFDIAMFERCISLSFAMVDYDEKQLTRARALKEMESSGIFSQALAQVHALRPVFESRFADSFDEVRKAFMQVLDSTWPDATRKPKERYISNYLIPLTAYSMLCEELRLPFKLSDVMDAMIELLVEQTSNIYSEDDVSRFWDIFLYCVEHPGILDKDDDYQVRLGPAFNVRSTQRDNRVTTPAQIAYNERILFVRMEKLFPEYQDRHNRLYRRNGLGKSALIHYLRGSEGYIGSTQIFTKFGPKQYIAFRMEKLPFTLRVTDEERDDKEMSPNYNPDADKQGDLPF